VEPSGPVQACNGIALPFCLLHNKVASVCFNFVFILTTIFEDLCVQREDPVSLTFSV
jgi:hypothetical protein